MRHIIDELYESDIKDLNKTISRFEFENRDYRNKVDIAELYLEMKVLKDALTTAGIDYEKVDEVERDLAICAILKEDKRDMENDLADAIHQEILVSEAKRGSLWQTLATKTTKHVHVKSKASKNVQKMLKNRQGEKTMEDMVMEKMNVSSFYSHGEAF